MAEYKQLDQSTFRAFENAAAGHDGVLSDEDGELVIKPCTEAEILFYQETLEKHPDFAELMPTFLGTLQLGAPAHAKDALAATDVAVLDEQKDHDALHGKKISGNTAIVLENLEHGFQRPNVLDIKLGSRLYAPGTAQDKADRLDKVAAETTSSSLYFRIAGMKVWNSTISDYDVYDKLYGRKLTADTINDGLSTFFVGLTTGVRPDDARLILETILAEISKIRHALERSESRMYSSSILIVYESDVRALDTLMGGTPKTPRADEKAPTLREVKASEAAEEEEDEDEPPVPFKVKMIDFAHAAWTPGEGSDRNVIKGLKNVERQMDKLIAKCAV